MKRVVGFALLALVIAAAPALAYVVRLKDGTIIFARAAYTVKGTKAIITLENGIVTQYDLDKIDVPGTVDYNEKYKGNVIGIDTPAETNIATPQTTPVPAKRLGDLIRERKAQIKPLPMPNGPAGTDPSTASKTWNSVEKPVQETFAKFFGGAGITQYRLTYDQGKLRLLTTANSEEAVFNGLSAAARAVADLNAKGHDIKLEVVLTTSGGESGGTFLLTPEQARLLVNGQITVAAFFVRNVIL
ncbi:MAG TPA: hypothetical protein VGS00_10675 [Thermoanaerobaculia bacterium]|nr:hypothetical protein [Thermoanaerobaculia bacterium]